MIFVTIPTGPVPLYFIHKPSAPGLLAYICQILVIAVYTSAAEVSASYLGNYL